MLQPIQKDHELICPGCGCVLQEIQDPNHYLSEKQVIEPSLDIFLLGTILAKNVKFSQLKTKQQMNEERTLLNLETIVKEFGLPTSFIYDTFNQLKRNKRGFSSQKEPIKQLIKILEKDDNYIWINKLKAIKSKFEKEW